MSLSNTLRRSAIPVLASVSVAFAPLAQAGIFTHDNMPGQKVSALGLAGVAISDAMKEVTGDPNDVHNRALAGKIYKAEAEQAKPGAERAEYTLVVGIPTNEDGTKIVSGPDYTTLSAILPPYSKKDLPTILCLEKNFRPLAAFALYSNYKGIPISASKFILKMNRAAIHPVDGSD